VFDVNGTLDAQGVLHTAPRVAWVEEEYDPYEGLSESQAFFVMDLVELKGWDIDTAIAAALSD
jgi:hypothetical protein